MMISDRTYNFLKWFALIAIPAFNTFILTVGKIWELPYYVQIAATISAVGLLLAALIGASSKSYYDTVDDEDYNEDQVMLQLDMLEEDLDEEEGDE